MDNTQAQEILERNETFLKITVSKFMRRCSQKNRTGVISREDLLQEVTLCFLSEVEKHGEETAVAPVFERADQRMYENKSELKSRQKG